ncbi:MAG: FAD-dependent oxidoreductase [Oceanococcus sp.]|nr:MAG: FAD-dependent oxidoreductase [Oceanococcus sp.]
MRIAIIGGGIAGLATAYGLDAHHDVVLFEAADWLGGHTHTVDVPLTLASGATRNYAVDTGFIVFNDATYPHFIRLLDQLGLQGQATDMSFSVANGSLEYASHSLDGLFAQRRRLLSVAHLKMLREILRFNRQARQLVGRDDPRTLAEFLAGEGYSDTFRDSYLLPLCAAIWSASLLDAQHFPADHFARFFNNHGLLQLRDRPQWRVVPGGSRSYVERLQERLSAELRLNCPVESVQRHPDRVQIRSSAGSEQFDQVVFACHSDQALRLLADPSAQEQAILGALPYVDNDVVLHTDASILPHNPRAWASWNFRVSPDRGRAAAITYHMNRLQGLEAPVEFCVTLNQSDRIDPARVIERYRYAHPLYTPHSNQARAQRAQINGQQRSWYCGAYWYNGFHEDGARSALDVAQALGGGW